PPACSCASTGRSSNRSRTIPAPRPGGRETFSAIRSGDRTAPPRTRRPIADPAATLSAQESGLTGPDGAVTFLSSPVYMAGGGAPAHDDDVVVHDEIGPSDRRPVEPRGRAAAVRCL